MPEQNERTTAPAPPKWFGFLAMLMGGIIMAFAAELLPLDETKLHAPRWVLFLCGAAFAAAGGAVLTHGHPIAKHLLAPFIILALGTIGLWIALYGDPAQFRSNLPTSPETTVSLARIAFGIGGALCYLLVLGVAARAIWRLGQRQ